jgi:hypothetical protein
MTVFERRAAAVLFHLLRSRPDRRPFLVPANACPMIAWTFLEAGTPFRLVDIGDDLAMDRAQALDALAADPEAWGGVLFVRTYGALGEEAESFFRALRTLAPDLLAIDDRCLCRPVFEEPQGAETPGADVTLWSTGYSKYVDLGSGGFARLASHVPYERRDQADRPAFDPAALEEMERRTREALARRASWRPWGSCDRGLPGWLDMAEPETAWEEHRAALAEALPEADAHKRRLNAVYSAALPPEIQLPAAFHGWRFQIRVPRPAELIGKIFADGLFASRHYPALGPTFGEGGNGSFPRAEALHAEVVNLFNDRNFDEEKAARVAALVRRHLAGKT